MKFALINSFQYGSALCVSLLAYQTSVINAIVVDTIVNTSSVDIIIVHLPFVCEFLLFVSF